MKKCQDHFNFPNILKGNQGLSLIEILVALVLIAFATFSVIGNPFNSRQTLEDALTQLDRAVRFANQEALLKNKVVRIKLDMSTEPHSFTVEISQHSQLILPESQDTNSFSKDELEVYLKNQAKFNQGFSPVDEFKKNSKEINEDIKIVAIASSYNKKIVSGEPAYIYFYPIGYRDASLIFLASIDEVAEIRVQSVQEETFLQYYPMPAGSTFDNIQQQALNIISPIVKEWLNENS